MTSPKKALTHVVAGVLRDAQDRLLLTQRGVGKHLAGLWEFPGGKCEPTELPQAALRRELQEELGVVVEAARPLIRIPWIYPEYRILLDVYRIDIFHGVPYSREGQALHWQKLAEIDSLELPPADRPILHALRLPTHYVITSDCRSPVQSWLATAEAVLKRGERLLQLRAPSLQQPELRAIAIDLRDCCHAYGAELLINGDIELADELQLDGVHLRAAQLSLLTQRPLPIDRWVVASCHNLAELQLANKINVDFVTLSPIRTTPSHPQSQALGWELFVQLCEVAPFPVYALGGLNPKDVADAQNNGAHGVAGISAFWSMNAAV